MQDCWSTLRMPRACNAISRILDDSTFARRLTWRGTGFMQQVHLGESSPHAAGYLRARWQDVEQHVWFCRKRQNSRAPQESTLSASIRFWLPCCWLLPPTGAMVGHDRQHSGSPDRIWASLSNCLPASQEAPDGRHGGQVPRHLFLPSPLVCAMCMTFLAANTTGHIQTGSG